MKKNNRTTTQGSIQSINIQSHLNAPKLRIDTWNILAGIANEVHYISNPKKAKAFENDINHCLEILKPIERYHAFPGINLCQKIEMLFYRNEFQKFHELISLIIEALHSNTANYKELLRILKADEINYDEFIIHCEGTNVHYFEVLVVLDLSKTEMEIFRKEMEGYFVAGEKFIYELVFVKSTEDAIVAAMFNFNIKCCLISDFFKLESNVDILAFKNIIQRAKTVSAANVIEKKENPATTLCKIIKNLRQKEITLYYLSSHEPEKSAASESNCFDKIFYAFESYFEMHLSIIQDIKNRYETPFFDALKRYTFEPKSTFHALPIARGKSVFTSRWIRDMHEFYGKNIFLAESSSTAGGLDSLLNPIGSIKSALKKASDFFGSDETYFVTSGTSASNKIVLQATLQPEDIVMLEHSCHDSHHYGVILTGAHPLYLNGYPLTSVDLRGPVPLSTIKKNMIELKREGKLDLVKLIVFTNCTFDGLVYNVEKYMEEILSIKPDMIFLWDEAWFAYARCVPHYRLRTAMYVAGLLDARYKSPEYRKAYEEFKAQSEASGDPDEYLLNNHGLPDPDKVKIRVYSTQSTHKTLSCMRQGSMIHIYDHHFSDIKERFSHAFITHVTTSPNYQIIATMDLARRQADLEGFELVQNAIELSMIFRQQVNKHPVISQFFQALGPTELIPEEFRFSKVASGYDPTKDWATVEKAWILDDVVVDPTRVTLLIKAHTNGYLMRMILMDRFGIQVNKVSFNSLLIQFNIGTFRSSVSYLLEALYAISKKLEESEISKKSDPYLIPPPPGFSEFGGVYRVYKNLLVGNLRKAYYHGQDLEMTEYVVIPELLERLKKGEEIICAALVIPVPPGFPALLPGQVITEPILQYIISIDPLSVLGGYSPLKGIRIFRRVD